MRNTLLISLATVALLSGGMLGHRAEAMTLPAPPALGVAVEGTALVQKAALVCGYRGCVRIWPRYYQRAYIYGYHRRPLAYGYYRRPYAYGYYGRRW